MIKVAICDDEVQEGALLVAMLKDYEKQRKNSFTIDVYTEGESLIAAAVEYNFILLDIEMERMNGIAVGQSIWKKNKQTNIIFITNLSNCREMAQNRVHAFAYLTKPVDQEVLFRQLDDVLSQLDAEEKEKDSLKIVTIKQEHFEIPIQDILYFEYKDRKVLIHTMKNIYIIKENIGDMEKSMKTFDFVMPHQSFLVNLRYINHIQKYEIRLTNEDTIPLSQKRSAMFRKIFHEYITKIN